MTAEPHRRPGTEGAAVATTSRLQGEPDERLISGPGTFALGAETAVVVREGPVPASDEQAGRRWVWFDGDRLSWPLRLRRRRPGDRMRPRGGTGSRKLSDLLIDAKVPKTDRSWRPVVTAADGELLFVPGLRPSQAAAPDKMTRRLVGLAGVPMVSEPTFTATQG